MIEKIDERTSKQLVEAIANLENYKDNVATTPEMKRSVERQIAEYRRIIRIKQQIGEE